MQPTDLNLGPELHPMLSDHDIGGCPVDDHDIGGCPLDDHDVGGYPVDDMDLMHSRVED